MDCLKRSSKTKNLAAAIDYINCMQEVDKKYGPLKFLLEYEGQLLEEDLKDKQNQRLFLHIAFSYLDESMYENALKYFLKSVNLNPGSYMLKVILLFLTVLYGLA